MKIPYTDIAAIVSTWDGSHGYGPHIADRFGVPLATARRWVYQTRRRGLLPAGTATRRCRYCAGTGVTAWGVRPGRGVPR